MNIGPSMSMFASREDYAKALSEYQQDRITELERWNAELVAALHDVVAIADRDTEPFIRAHALLAGRKPTAANAGKLTKRCDGCPYDE